jgi:aryl-alcohol dehydrogenase-like predicted oxidoreductase
VSARRLPARDYRCDQLGLLTGKYLNGVPSDSRAAHDSTLSRSLLTEQRLDVIRRLNQTAEVARANATSARESPWSVATIRTLDPVGT